MRNRVLVKEAVIKHRFLVETGLAIAVGLACPDFIGAAFGGNWWSASISAGIAGLFVLLLTRSVINWFAQRDRRSDRGPSVP